MTKQSIHIGDNEVLDAALESVAAEVQSKPQKDSPTDKKVADLEQQIREANDRALRSHAELENFRKRSQRELADERKYAIVPFAKDLLAVVDNLERAIEAANTQITRLSDTQTRSASEGSTSSTPTDVTHLLDGVKLVASQLETILK